MLRASWWWGTLAAVTIVLGHGGPARAQATEQEEAPHDPARDAEARGLFEAGRAAFADGRFEDALRYFEQSHDLSHRAELLYNIGSAADRLQRETQALEAFEGYLAALPEAPNRREVEGRIRVLREHIAREQAERDAAAAAATTTTDPDALDPTTAPVVDPLAQDDTRPSGGGVESEWWFWTLIGVGLAGAGVLTGVLVVTSQEVHYPPYTTGDEGTIAFTLTASVPFR